MKRFSVLTGVLTGITAGLIVGFGASTFAAEPEHAWSFQGINLLPTSENAYGSRAACDHVEGLKTNFGINSVVTRQYLVLPSYEDSTIDKKDFVQDEQIQKQLRIDQALGVKSVLSVGIKLKTDMDANSKPSQSSIEFATVDEYDHFFSEYQSHLLKYATMLRKDGNVGIFSIGNDLTSLTLTKRLKNAEAIQTYFSTVTWDKVNKLIRFKASLAQHGATALPLSTSWFQWVKDGVLNTLLDKDHHRDLAELRSWSASNGRAALSANAKSYVVDLENSRRTYLKAMWVQTIQKVRDEFSNVPDQKRPVLTYNADYQIADQVDFWRDLDQISVSTYLQLGSDHSVHALEGEWTESLKGFDQFVRAMDPPKKVVFSELVADKFPSDPEAHANAIEALNHVVAQGSVPWLDGILFWDSYVGKSRSLSGSYGNGTCQRIFLKKVTYTEPAVAAPTPAVKPAPSAPQNSNDSNDPNAHKPTTEEQFEKLKDLLF